MASRLQPTLCQIAVVTPDLPRGIRFYSELLGLRYAGYIPLRGHVAASNFDVPSIDGACHWLTGDDAFFQVELIHLHEPAILPMTRRPDEVGYQRIGVDVPNLDAAFRTIEKCGGRVLSAAQRGADGDRAWASDPDGVLLELRAPTPVAARPRIAGIAAVVDNLDDAEHYFSDGFGLEKLAPGDARGWHSLPAAENSPCPPPAERVTFATGPYWLELNRYSDRRARSELHAPRLNEQGLMNIALGVRKTSEFKHLYQTLLQQGRRGTTDPIGSPFGYIVYMQPTNGLSVEVLQLAPSYDSIWGFKPPGLAAAAVQRVIRFLIARPHLVAGPARAM